MNPRKTSLVLALLVLSGCGHVIRPELAPNHGRFDFSDPPCRLSPKPALGANEVAIRYLGAGGLYVEWQGSALLMAPFFSNPPISKVLLKPLKSDPWAVRRGLYGMDLSRVRAIAAGHSHYDHIGDLPLLAREYLPGVPIWVNQTGANALAGESIPSPVEVLEKGPEWIRLQDSSGHDLPIRFRKVPSKHAPHLWGILIARGKIDQRWTKPWEKHHWLSLKTGTTFAFVIDLMSPDDTSKTLFRIYYQDAANPRGVGAPVLDAGDSKPFDLAVLCMASYTFVRQHPESILGAVKPLHILISHYEDFFQDRAYPVRFVFPLINSLANRFLVRTREAIEKQETVGPGPEGTVCGPSTPAYTMPMPGEWMRFRIGKVADAPVGSTAF
jgi:hypothetical protein